MKFDFESVRALTFDVFGTVVDWRSAVVREGRALGRRKGLDVDWEAFADEWRGGYRPAMERVAAGELPWTRMDGLHRMILDKLLAKFGVGGLEEADIVEFNRVWHRLDPWPDAVEGVVRLRRRFPVVALSNGNVSLLIAMAKRAGLPWDAVFSAEMVRRYKPDPRVYLAAAEWLDLEPRQVLMVAAHKTDLRAAAAAGLRTAFTARPLEWGPNGRLDLAPEADFDLNVGDFHGLAERFAC